MISFAELSTSRGSGTEITFLASPSYIKRDDIIGGLRVEAVSAGRHDDQHAIALTLQRPEALGTTVGRLILLDKTTSSYDQSVEETAVVVTRYFLRDSERDSFIRLNSVRPPARVDASMPAIEARALSVGAYAIIDHPARGIVDGMVTAVALRAASDGSISVEVTLDKGGEPEQLITLPHDEVVWAGGPV